MRQLIRTTAPTRGAWTASRTVLQRMRTRGDGPWRAVDGKGGRQDKETNGVLPIGGRCQQQKSGGRVGDFGDGVLIVRSRTNDSRDRTATREPDGSIERGEPELTWLTLTSWWKRGRGTRKHMPPKLGENSRREPETVELERLTSMCWNHRILAARRRSCWLPRMTAAGKAKHSSSEAPNRVTAALSGRRWAPARPLVGACSIEVHGWEEVGLENGAVQGRRADREGRPQPKLMLLFPRPPQRLMPDTCRASEPCDRDTAHGNGISPSSVLVLLPSGFRWAAMISCWIFRDVWHMHLVS